MNVFEEYNSRLRGWSERRDKIYRELEGKGIVLLRSLRSEMESEVLSNIDMSSEEMDSEIVRYVIKCLVEDIWR